MFDPQRSELCIHIKTGEETLYCAYNGRRIICSQCADQDFKMFLNRFREETTKMEGAE